MSKKKQMIEGQYYRSAQLVLRDDSKESRHVELSFSSEEPYERCWGIEVLGHGEDEIDLDFFKTGNAPLLVGHHPDDLVGVIEEVTIGDDKKGRAVVRFGQSTRAEEVFKDVLDGIRTNVSVGYFIEKVTEISREDETPVYRVTRWRPIEVSLVSVPADTTVGVGREHSHHSINPNVTKEQERNNAMPKPVIETPKSAEPDLTQIRAEAAETSRKEALEIMTLGHRFNMAEDANKAVEEGKSLDAFRAQILERQGAEAKPAKPDDADIGMSERETQQFSFVRALNALANPSSKKAQDAAGFEFEASRAAAQKYGQEPKGIMVPAEVLRADMANAAYRTPMNVGRFESGGASVATELLTGSFIDLLRKKRGVIHVGRNLSNGAYWQCAVAKAC